VLRLLEAVWEQRNAALMGTAWEEEGRGKEAWSLWVESNGDGWWEKWGALRKAGGGVCSVCIRLKCTLDLDLDLNLNFTS
jgi:hypothetical protein